MNDEADRKTRAQKRQAKLLDQVDWSWKKWKKCALCGTAICINCMSKDREPQPEAFTYMGKLLCGRCDPRKYDPSKREAMAKLNKPDLSREKSKLAYRNLLSVMIVERLAKRECERGPTCGKCAVCLAKKVTRLGL